jgi:hypothetical protein
VRAQGRWWKQPTLKARGKELTRVNSRRLERVLTRGGTGQPGVATRGRAGAGGAPQRDAVHGRRRRSGGGESLTPTELKRTLLKPC